MQSRLRAATELGPDNCVDDAESIVRQNRSSSRFVRRLQYIFVHTGNFNERTSTLEFLIPSCAPTLTFEKGVSGITHVVVGNRNAKSESPSFTTIQNNRYILLCKFNREAKAAEAARNICAVYGKNVIEESTIRKWLCSFNDCTGVGSQICQLVPDQYRGVTRFRRMYRKRRMQL
ncbi:hypothetical protein ANN_23813 [Periplaneta americana]|uniref:Mos1 transposase HTH domain-containing protein n=1 Tax=Periplaneta americana TaxID=6978 RepID=A0ABQ8SM58_PERAM|nr:hypothetical protein ANN_23813 [Periplaneta americana]